MAADFEKTSFAATHKRQRITWALKVLEEVKEHLLFTTDSDTLIDLKLLQAAAQSIIDRDVPKT